MRSVPRHLTCDSLMERTQEGRLASSSAGTLSWIQLVPHCAANGQSLATMAATNWVRTASGRAIHGGAGSSPMSERSVLGLARCSSWAAARRRRRRAVACRLAR